MTYLLLYIILSRNKLVFLPKHFTYSLWFSFKRAPVKQIIIKLSLVWPNPYLFCLCSSAKRARKRANSSGGASYPPDFDRLNSLIIEKFQVLKSFFVGYSSNLMLKKIGIKVPLLPVKEITY